MVQVQFGAQIIVLREAAAHVERTKYLEKRHKGPETKTRSNNEGNPSESNGMRMGHGETRSREGFI